MRQFYLRALERRPMLVKACTSCITFSLTDILAQQRERSTEQSARPRAQIPQGQGQGQDCAALAATGWSPSRTFRNGMFGFLYLGPLNHIIWGKIVGLEFWFPGSSWRAVLSRVAVDQATNMSVCAN